MNHPDLLRRLDEMPVGKVRVTRRRPMPPVAEPADEQQVLARHDGMTGYRVSQIVDPKLAGFCIRANRPPGRSRAKQR